MNIKKINTCNKLCLIAAIAACSLIALNASATQITGAVTFSGAVGLDTSSAGTAHEVTTWSSQDVTSSSGTLGALAVNSAITLPSAWYFDTSTPMVLWTAGSFTFTLISSAIVYQNANFVDVSGMGTISSSDPGLSANTMTWNFSTSNPGTGSPTTFSSQVAGGTPVSDGASTLILLGVCLLGVGMFRHFVPKSKSSQSGRYIQGSAPAAAMA